MVEHCKIIIISVKPLSYNIMISFDELLTSLRRSFKVIVCGLPQSFPKSQSAGATPRPPPPRVFKSTKRILIFKAFPLKFGEGLGAGTTRFSPHRLPSQKWLTSGFCFLLLLFFSFPVSLSNDLEIHRYTHFQHRRSGNNEVFATLSPLTKVVDPPFFFFVVVVFFIPCFTQ